jgi:SOS-response transcriptional repressor LexA
MTTINNCPNRAQCSIGLLARRRFESRSAAWALLLSAGQDLCDGGSKENAHRSFEQALKLADDLVAVNDKDAKRIQATGLTCLGALSLCDKDAKGAIDHLLRGESIFEQDGDKYGRAVALFGLAQAHWMRKEWVKVFRYFERSRRELDHISSDSATVYFRQLVEEQYAEAIAEWERTPREKPVKWGIEDILGDVSIGVFPIFGKIPAGNPHPIPQLVTDYIETDRFIIDGKPYRVVGSQRDKFRLSFSLHATYIAFRVEGDSMNKANLDDGDYVILRVPSVGGADLEPNNGDIVAVALPETDAVTLKRFRRKGGQVVFEPDSTNPNHVSYPFVTSSEYGIPFKIVGIHVATLKPQ